MKMRMDFVDVLTGNISMQINIITTSGMNLSGILEAVCADHIIMKIERNFVFTEHYRLVRVDCIEQLLN